MKALLITNKGLEKISALEIKEILKASSKIEDSVVIFEANEEDLCRICYAGRSFSKAMALLESFEFESIEDIGNKFNADISGFLKGKTFAVRCERIGEHDFSSQDVAKTIGGKIFQEHNAKVDLKNPDLVFFAYIYGKKLYFGIDYSGEDISKREYKIFSHRASIKGNLAFAMLKVADYRPEEILLDPFCGGGTIPIEAALYASAMPPHFHSKNIFAFLKFIKFDFSSEDKKIDLEAKTRIFASDSDISSIIASDKNAKIAGIKGKIKFAKLGVERLDTKFDETSVDKIVTNPPSLGSSELENLAAEFFCQASRVLKKNGIVVILCREPIIWKNKAKGFALSDEIGLFSGKEKMTILKFQKT